MFHQIPPIWITVICLSFFQIKIVFCEKVTNSAHSSNNFRSAFLKVTVILQNAAKYFLYNSPSSNRIFKRCVPGSWDLIIFIILTASKWNGPFPPYVLVIRVCGGTTGAARYHLTHVKVGCFTQHCSEPLVQTSME